MTCRKCWLINPFIFPALVPGCEELNNWFAVENCAVDGFSVFASGYYVSAVNFKWAPYVEDVNFSGTQLILFFFQVWRKKCMFSLSNGLKGCPSHPLLNLKSKKRYGGQHFRKSQKGSLLHVIFSLPMPHVFFFAVSCPINSDRLPHSVFPSHLPEPRADSHWRLWSICQPALQQPSCPPRAPQQRLSSGSRSRSPLLSAGRRLLAEPRMNPEHATLRSHNQRGQTRQNCAPCLRDTSQDRLMLLLLLSLPQSHVVSQLAAT